MTKSGIAFQLVKQENQLIKPARDVTMDKSVKQTCCEQ